MFNVVKRLVLLVAFLRFCTNGTNEDEVPTLTFQADGIPTIDSWAKYKKTFPDLKDFTVCLYMKFLKGRTSYDTLISYAVPLRANEIYIGFAFPDAFFTVWKEMDLAFIGNVSVKLLQWIRFCYIQDYKEGKVKLWWNDNYEERDSDKLDVVEGKGAFYLAQDQDEINGGFTIDQSMNVIVGDLRFFDLAIDHTEAERFVNCDNKMSSVPFMDFSNISSDWILNGSVEIGTDSLEEICAPAEPFYLVFPEKRTFQSTLQLCDSFKAQIPAPLNEEENAKLVPHLLKYHDICPDGNGNNAWLGVIGDPVNKTHHYYKTGAEISYQNFYSTFYVDRYDCVSMLTMHNLEGKWFVARCNAEPMCGVCKFQHITEIKTRGLCERSLFDPIFLAAGYKNRKINLRGFFYSDLHWDENTWFMQYMVDNKTRAKMIMKTQFDYPLGKHEWLIYGDQCSSDPEVKSPIVFTTCGENEYTCDDGTCVLLENRCDLLQNCPDKSDEVDCDIIQVSPSYIKVLPPPEEDGSSLKVKVDLMVTSIRSFSLIDLTLSYDLTISLEWKDPRLIYQNLKKNIEQNQVSLPNVEEIWVPNFFLEDESGSKVNIIDHGSQTFIHKVSDPVPDDVKRLKEDKLFPGSLNPLNQKRILTLSFLCQFDLSNYPFDVQRCKLVLRAAQGERSVTFLAGGAEFLGERRLLEYQVNEIFSEAHIVNGFSEVNFVITFFNLYKYYIFGTYVPTSLIVFITYMTFYFSVADFTNRIMISLTALMVLAALFLQTNQGVARTAYMKLIDVWFIFCMVFNFIIILVLVVINYVLENRPTSAVQPLSFKVNGMFTADEQKTKISLPTPTKINTIFRIFFPCFFMTFTLGYTIFIFLEWSIPLV